MTLLDDKTNLFEERHPKNKYVTVHVKNIRKFMIEIFIYGNGLMFELCFYGLSCYTSKTYLLKSEKETLEKGKKYVQS